MSSTKPPVSTTLATPRAIAASVNAVRTPWRTMLRDASLSMRSARLLSVMPQRVHDRQARCVPCRIEAFERGGDEGHPEGTRREREVEQDLRGVSSRASG